MLHYLECKLLSLRIRVRYAQHPHAHLIQTGIAQADGRIIVVQETVNLLSLLQACQRAVLPQDGCDI